MAFFNNRVWTYIYNVWCNKPPMEAFFIDLLHALSLPQYGLLSIFVISFLAATLIPLTPTPFVIGLIKLNPEMFWPVVLVATLGNTLGGCVDWLMGYGAKSLYDHSHKNASYGKVMSWLKKFGPKACLLSWMPVVGDPLSVAAGWLRLSFWPCMFYMLIGRFGRFLFIAVTITWLWPGAIEL